jgi:putative hemolysin
MDPDLYLPVVLPVLALLATNAFFVTAEYALLALPRGRFEPTARDPRGRTGLIGVARPEDVLLVAQLGRSVSTLGLGYAVARLGFAAAGAAGALEPAVVFAALAVGAIVHAVLSGQIPKLVGIHHSGSRVAQLVVAPLGILALLLRPIVGPLAWFVRIIARWMGVSTPAFIPLHTQDEIRSQVSQWHEQGVVEEDEREMIHGVFEFSETVAREVMTPRIDMVAVPDDVTLDAALDLLIREGHSRLPVYEGTIDAVVGVLLAKDLLPLFAATDEDPRVRFDVRKLMRAPYFVPDTKPVDDILAEFRQQSVHLAIVLDEFGGTYGLLTMEDLLEEIVGEINDEYDVAEPEFSATPEGDVLIDGGAALSEVNERFDLSLPEEDFDTLGGYIFGMLGRVPLPGDEVAALGDSGGLVLHVEEIEDRRITRVRLTRPVPVAEGSE